MDYWGNDYKRTRLEKGSSWDGLEKDNNEEYLKSEYRIVEYNEDKSWHRPEVNLKKLGEILTKLEEILVKFMKGLPVAIGLMLFAFVAWHGYATFNTGFGAAHRNYTRNRDRIKHYEVGFLVSESENYRYLFNPRLEFLRSPGDFNDFVEGLELSDCIGIFPAYIPEGFYFGYGRLIPNLCNRHLDIEREPDRIIAINRDTNLELFEFEEGFMGCVESYTINFRSARGRISIDFEIRKRFDFEREIGRNEFEYYEFDGGIFNRSAIMTETEESSFATGCTRSVSYLIIESKDIYSRHFLMHGEEDLFPRFAELPEGSYYMIFRTTTSGISHEEIMAIVNSVEILN